MSDSTIADKIREYILKHNGAAASDVNSYDQAMNVDNSSDTVKGMADGGEVEAPTAFDTDETPDSNDADNEKVVSSHPGNQPADLDSYIKGQEGQLDKWSPDKEAAVMQHLNQGYKTPGFLLSEGAAGLGDAIMQGVSRAGPSNFLNTVERNKENNIKNTSDQLNHLQEGNYKQVAAKGALEAQRPGSAMNQAATPVLAATLKAMGIPEGDISKFLTNPTEARRAIDTLKEVIPAKDKIKIENELKIIELRLQEANMNATHTEHQNQQAIEKSKAEEDALKELGGMKWYNRLLHPGIAGALKQKAGLEKPGLPDYSDNLPSGSTYKAPDGTIRRKK